MACDQGLENLDYLRLKMKRFLGNIVSLWFML